MIKWRSFDDLLWQSSSDQKRYFLGLDTTCSRLLYETVKNPILNSVLLCPVLFLSVGYSFPSLIYDTLSVVQKVPFTIHWT
jgi:hypothetical protein